MMQLPDIVEGVSPEAIFEPDEKVVWHGAPPTGTIWRWSSLVSILISLVVLPFLLVAPYWLALILLPILFWLSVWRLVQDAEAREHTRYVLTNRRLLLLLTDRLRAIDRLGLSGLGRESNGDIRLVGKGNPATFLADAFSNPAMKMDRLTLSKADAAGFLAQLNSSVP